MFYVLFNMGSSDKINGINLRPSIRSRYTGRLQQGPPGDKLNEGL